MATDDTSAAASQAWAHAVLPAYWTNDLAAARRSLLALAEAHRVEEIDRIHEALDLVEKSHRGQFRKGTDAPYAVHPVRLACVLVDSFGVTAADVLCAALLHDLLEDTQVTPEEIEHRFGARCAELVAIVTRRPGEGRPATGDDAGALYLLRIRNAGDDAILLKMADKVDNLRDATSHPDRERVAVFVGETFPAYVPLARRLTDPQQAWRAERLLLEAAARAGGNRNPQFLRALLNLVSRSVDKDDGWTEIAFPEIAIALYRFLNPNVRIWLEFDGIAITRTDLAPRELAARVASALRREIVSPNLPLLLDLAGVPPAFASRANDDLWRRAAEQLALLQRLLSSGNPPPWLSVLLRSGNEPLLLAIIQASLYLPASWRSPLWSADLGAVLSERVLELTEEGIGDLSSFTLSHRLALFRYGEGSGTRQRAARIFEHHAEGRFSADAQWACRIGMESLQRMSSGLSEGGTSLEELWMEVHDKPFDERSLPARQSVLAPVLGDSEGGAFVETSGVPEMRALFTGPGLEEQFAHLSRVLLRSPLDAGWSRWIEFDHEEWRKRRPRWSQAGQLRIHSGAAIEELEALGARLIRRRFGTTEWITVLPARKFALQDRLPEVSAGALEAIERGRFEAVAILDSLIPDFSGSIWTPRLYRVLDTIEDLDPHGVQTLTVEYDGREEIPRLQAYLPLPADDDQADRQADRKALLARYIVAQVYSCGLVRRIARARISCSAVAESRRRHAFTDAELRKALAAAEKESGLRAAFGSYIERYGFDPFGITSDGLDLAAFHFGAAEMRQGVYVGIDIGGQRVKIAVVRDGRLIDNPRAPEIRTPAQVTVAEFCRQVLSHVSRELQDTTVRWEEIGGIGVSWPGAVRDNRIVGMSGTLLGLSEDGKPFQQGDPVDRLGVFDILAYFAAECRATAAQEGAALDEDLTLSLLNDGDAEAFGDHALRTLKGLGRPGGKIFVKLGTGLAGGRITAAGAVAEDVAEYAKIVLSVPPPAARTPWANLARHSISAEGVRNLSRTFVFDGALLFGVRGGANDDKSATRIEPVEMGRLLPLFAGGDERTAFLLDLVATDNRGTPGLIAEAVHSTAAALRTTKREALANYIRERGNDLGREWPGWQSGLRRTLWLCTGSESGAIGEAEVLPEEFPYDELARTIVGTVALFSQLGLHVAHLIAQLYNIYRRGTFSEVVLAGGVLGGQSGEIVESQTKGFLRKDYDKIYGEGKPLGPATLVRAGFEGVPNPGVFGAAMAANRQRQVARDRRLSLLIDARLRLLPLGEEFAIEEILALADHPALRPRALRLLEQHFATGVIARTKDGRLQKIV